MISEKVVCTVPYQGKTTLEYSVLEDNLDGVRSFGIEVKKKLGDKVLDKNKVSAITPSKDEIEAILKMLLRGTVPPCALCDVLADYVDSRQYVPFKECVK